MDINWAMLIVTAVASAAAVASAIVAAVQARGARSSKQGAQESARLAAASTAAVIKRADVAEKALALEEERDKPPAWSVKFVGGDTYAMVNTSNRTIHLVELDIEPDGTERLFRMTAGEDDGVYEPGQSFDFMISKAMAARPRRLILGWRFVDEPSAPLTRTALPL